MTIRKTYMLTLLCLLLGVGTTVAATTDGNPPKREIRAAWVTTAWAIDWPTSWGGGSSNVSKQQAELTALLDKLKAANMNTAFFQIRSFSDAMYKSSYEPWSRYLSGTRGTDPGWDPLAYAVEYAHQIGMELHAWVNPYRYSSSADTYSNSLPNDYAKTHPEWLMNSDDYTIILNPGIPEVRDQIVKVISEVVRNYDIDGVLFDDYFYINGGTKDEQDQTYYEQNNPEGLSRADWRREQVNIMVRQVHDAIKAIKPYCRFGISPAGVAATNKDVAAKYGVEPAPVSSDWQYNGIYSDPLAWISEQSIDYISPQIYWPIGSSADYDRLCNWWSKVANKFGRHFYSSSSLSDLSKNGNQEYVNQVKLNRAYDRNGATGSVFYGISTGFNKSGFMEHMKANAFSNPSLPVNMAWYPVTADYRVSGITLTGMLLKWNAPTTNVRYAVYAIPTDSIGKPGVFASSKYLLGMSYRPTYILSSVASADYSYAVSVVDRYGNEHTPVVMGQAMQTILPAELTFPAQEGTPLLPCYFTWKAVDKADSYLFQLAETADFATVLYQCETVETTFYSGNITFLEEGKTYYWRIRTRAINAKDTWSEVRSFVGKNFNSVAPADTEQDVSQTPLLRCDSVAADDAQYTFEIATAATFADNKIILTATAGVPRYQVLESQILAPSTTYYLRSTVRFSGVTAISAVTSFRTLDLPTPVPTILSPLTGTTVFGTEVVVTWAEQNARGFRLELSTATSFAPRLTKAKVVDAFTFTYTYTEVEPGTYYLRIKASGADGYTEPSEVQTIEVVPATGVDDILNATCYIAGHELVAPVGSEYVVYAVDGRQITAGVTSTDRTQLPMIGQGVYLVRVGDSALRYQVW